MVLNSTVAATDSSISIMSQISLSPAGKEADRVLMEKASTDSQDTTGRNVLLRDANIPASHRRTAMAEDTTGAPVLAKQVLVSSVHTKAGSAVNNVLAEASTAPSLDTVAAK